MKTTLSRKISIALLIANLIFITTCFVMFFPQRGFSMDFGTGATFASLITLGFGGSWEHPNPYVDTYGGNATFAIAFIFVCIALVLAIVLLYGYISKKFLPKHILNLSVITIILMLFASVTVCFTRQAAAGIMAQHSSSTKIDFLKFTHFRGSTIILIVFGFLSVASYIVFAAIPYIKNKIAKK